MLVIHFEQNHLTRPTPEIIKIVKLVSSLVKVVVMLHLIHNNIMCITTSCAHKLAFTYEMMLKSSQPDPFSKIDQLAKCQILKNTFYRWASWLGQELFNILPYVNNISASQYMFELDNLNTNIWSFIVYLMVFGWNKIS